MSKVGRTLGTVMGYFPPSLVRAMAKQYTAGTSVQDAMGHVRHFADLGMASTMSVLGEAAKDREYASEQVQGFIDSIKAVDASSRPLDVRFAVKVTALGLGVSRDLALENLITVAKVAAASGRLVEVDMEQTVFIDATLDLVRSARAETGNIGAVVQAYLHRTRDDVDALIEDRIPTRIVKGAYLESGRDAYQQYEVIREQFSELVSSYLDARVPVGIATHDEFLINRALEHARKNDIPRDVFEIQMLKGVQETLRAWLVESGYNVRVVMNFGEDLHLWSIRRLQENPNIVKHVLRSNLGGTKA